MSEEALAVVQVRNDDDVQTMAAFVGMEKRAQI